MRKKMKVAILGGGLIGTDLLVKIMRSPWLECTGFISRNLNSSRMLKAINLGVFVSDKGIGAIEENPDQYDLIFDATSAAAHKIHAPIFEKLRKIVIDLTPAKIGKMCVPAVNISECLNLNNVNMITCGGQASIPLAYTIGQVHKDVKYIEVVSTISSRSAGPATRANLDEYIDTTENGIKHFSSAEKSKAILILNPADPCINMQTTVCAIVSKPEINKLKEEVHKMITFLKTYVPGYELVVEPTVEDNRIFMMIRVNGLGDFLPSYAGNLDIINCAAIAMAEKYAIQKYGEAHGK
ncbi:MAG: acetaldehyde dehydrogenase (acetylating) [Oligoflexia bacterium]|nr:acetaldehyde dehydrogenase (acetylating) [Oligoflexia bacterium]